MFKLSFGQQAAVSFPNNNLVYKDTETPLQIAVAGYGCKDIIIKCSNGKISPIDACRYIYTPAKIGETLIDVYVIKKRDTLLTGRQMITVKERPLPEANIAGFKGGRITKGNLKAQGGVAASFYVSGNHWESCEVNNYHVVIIRDKKIIFEHFNQGNTFNPQVAEAFRTLLKEDRVAFFNMSASLADGKNYVLKGLEFLIDN